MTTSAEAGRGVALGMRGGAAALLCLTLAGCGELQSIIDKHKPPKTVTATYANPLPIAAPSGKVESCADPSIIRGQTNGDTNWYLYCTTDPHNSADRDASGSLNFHLISISKSSDLVNWTYVGDAFASRPSWVRPDAGLWAPDIEYQNGRYYLYYTASDTVAGGSAIGVATSDSPVGPWADSGKAVVEPQPPPGSTEGRRWTFDPDVIQDEIGQKWIYYGSYFGGLSVRKLSADGLKSDPASQVQVAIPNRYEGANVVRHGGYYYLFGSAANCCNGPLTGYSVFAGRSESPTGPFVDREGVSLLAGRVGGTPVISMNGNRWVGPGHEAVFTDEGGQDWVVYHAIDRTDPYIDVATNINKRAPMLDPLDWVDGWPTVRGGLWASDQKMPAPAAQPGQVSAYRAPAAPQDTLGPLQSAYSDEFNTNTLDPRWSWVRPPAANTYGLENGAFRFDTQAGDLFVDSNTASVLTEAAPSGNYAVEVKVNLNLPPEGCCQNFVQAGLVVYGGDDAFVKLAHFSNFETRQIEFAKEVSSVPAGYPRYGNTVLSAPAETTWLRVVKRDVSGEEHYTAYSSRDGVTWTRGGTWTHQLGSGAKIGLISMGGTGFTARFDYVRVYQLGN